MLARHGKDCEKHAAEMHGWPPGGAGTVPEVPEHREAVRLPQSIAAVSYEFTALRNYRRSSGVDCWYAARFVSTAILASKNSDEHDRIDVSCR